MQRENYMLRDKARRLREKEPAAIEELARGELGMIKPGELLFIIKDVDASATPGTPIERPRKLSVRRRYCGPGAADAASPLAPASRTRRKPRWLVPVSGGALAARDRGS